MTHHLDELMRLHDEACDAECEYREALRIDVGVQAAGMKSGLADTALRTAIAKALDEARGEGAMTNFDIDRLIGAGRTIERYEHPNLQPLSESNFAIYDAARRTQFDYMRKAAPAPTQPATAGKEQ